MASASSSSSAAAPVTRMASSGRGPQQYQAVPQGQDRDDGDDEAGDSASEKEPEMGMTPPETLARSRQNSRFRNATYGLSVLVLVLLSSTVYTSLPWAFHRSAGPFSSSPDSSSSSSSCDCSGPSPPQYFQTSPQLWPGPTATGQPAFMAQTRVIDPTATYVPNDPLQTSIPIEGMQSDNASIFSMMGFLSPYAPAPGFGVDEYPLPQGAELVQVQMLSRHGARYPTSGSSVATLGDKIAEVRDSFTPKGSLAFLKDWEYHLGSNILVPRGRQELYDSGVLHSYMYGKLYNPNSKIIARTTTQDRMLKSAENWMAGFFGLEWTNNATIEVIIEENGFNNSLAGSLNCPNSSPTSTGAEARDIWVEKYLEKAAERFQSMTEGFEWTLADVYAAQTMCPYETVAYGYSRFCELFTYEEWQGFGYSIDLAFSGGSGFHSPTGRAVGIGYQQEVIARLQNHTLGYSGSQINVTLDSDPETFPLNQSLYFDFSHDTNIVSILTAFGLRQFAQEMPIDSFPGDHEFTVSHLTPFGARLDIEIIKTPKPLSANRDGYLRGEETKYVHFVLNQRTLPLGKSFPECDADRKDGWCELDTFLKVQEGMADLARYDYACFGSYPPGSFGDFQDGAPKSV